MNKFISTRGVRGAMVAWAALTLAAGTMPAMAAASGTEPTPSAASPHASGWSESRVTTGDATLLASTRPDARTTWVAGARFVQGSPNFAPTLWERDERKGSGWKRVKTAPVSPQDDVRFNDVDASSPRNGMLVGDYSEHAGGVVTQRWNGKAWKSAVAPVPRGIVGAGFTSVDTRAPDDAWAAGWTEVRPEGRPIYAGTLQHWDGTRWKAQKLPDIGAGGKAWYLQTVTALADDDVWAVGGTGFLQPEKPLLLHYDGTRWSKIAVPGVGAARARLNGIVAGPGGQVWAVGTTQASDGSRQALAVRYDGKKWVNVPLPKGIRELVAVAISQGGPVVLERKTAETSTALRYSGGKWVSMKLPADGATPYTASDISVSGRTIDVSGSRPGTGSQADGPGSLLTTRQ
ncbi:hypothetical protein [Streptomyces coffeae]|uniref:Secreted protein n=1 Tax=Streptomyces coffeae TaxID=621382 RepID=A0ABS1NAV1_9ACTN|nr:hypothetical protein [Streptomyces coffeae]MBL1097206.1 hypothetical protein [Streptomyces coffeae]